MKSHIFIPPALVFIPPGALLAKLYESGLYNHCRNLLDWPTQTKQVAQFPRSIHISIGEKQQLVYCCQSLGIPNTTSWIYGSITVIVGIGGQSRLSDEERPNCIARAWDASDDLQEWDEKLKRIWLKTHFPIKMFPTLWEAAKNDYEIYGHLLFLHYYAENKRNGNDWWKSNKTVLETLSG